MPRQFVINGETLVQVIGPSGSVINGIYQLGLASEAIQITLIEHSEVVQVDAYGKGNPIDEQVFGGEARIEMNLVHWNPTVMEAVIAFAFPGAGGEGALGPAGQLRGNQLALGEAGNSLLSLNLSSPRAGLPFHFPAAFIHERPYTWPVGTTRSIVRMVWKAIPFSVDPWNNGTGSLNVPIYSRTAIAVGANP